MLNRSFIVLKIRIFLVKVARILGSPTLSFSIPFYFGPYSCLQKLTLMPGNFGDARLNNYILEATYRSLSTGIQSLYNLPFFYPFPYMLGFTENLLGSSLFYIFPRMLGLSMETSYQLWYLISFVLNFASAYYCARLLKCSRLESNLVALIFTFALPVYARTGHTQFAFRFCIPFVITYLILFLEKTKSKYILLLYFWLSWLLWCNIYLTFFCILFLNFVFLSFLSHFILSSEKTKGKVGFLLSSFQPNSIFRHKTYIISFFAISLCNLIVLVPYWKCVELYRIARSKDEIISMLPRFSSYLFTEMSFAGKIFGGLKSSLPMAHEHQMFPGLIIATLLVCSFFLWSKHKNDVVYKSFLYSLLLIFLVTLCVKEESFWCLICSVPFFSGIRVLTRIDLVLLFPAAYICIKNLSQISLGSRTRSCIYIVCYLGICIESSFALPQFSYKKDWIRRNENMTNKLLQVSTQNRVLMFSNNPPYLNDEIDAMFAGLISGCPVVNGYSGSIVPGGNADLRPGQINELPRRLFIYKKLSIEKNLRSEKLEALLGKITPIGFEMNTEEYYEYLCLLKPSNVSVASESYPFSISSKLKLNILSKKKSISQNWIFVFLEIYNENNFPISCISSKNTPIRISWRFHNAKNVSFPGWDSRAELPFDLPHGKSVLVIPIHNERVIESGSLEVTLVQESLFWLHDHGLETCRIDWEKINQACGEPRAYGEIF